MSEARGFSVERWTRESRSPRRRRRASLSLALAVAPLIAGADVVDKLTTLFVYVILAAMWNALAGYAGLVSVGQQAFFGIGAYFAIQLAAHGLPAYPSLLAGAVGAALFAIPVLLLHAAPARRRVLDRHVGAGRGAASARQPGPADPGRDRHVDDLAQRLHPEQRRRDANYWLSLGSMLVLLGVIFCSLRSPFGASVQAIRDDEEAAASLGVRVLAAKRTVFVLAAFGCALAGVLWLATSDHLPAEDQFRRAVDRLHDPDGAGRRPRHVRGADPRGAPVLPACRTSSARTASGTWRGWARSPSSSRCSCRAACGARSRAASALRLLPVGYRLNVPGKS